VEKISSFELYRRRQQDVEILAFDELYERTSFIVATGAKSTLADSPTDEG
jgi:hypothetical protein